MPPVPPATSASAGGTTPPAAPPPADAANTPPAQPAATPAPPAAQRHREVRRIPLRWYILLWFPSLILRLWLRTLRITADPEKLAIWNHVGPGRLFILWHNRLLLCPELKRRFVPGNPVNGLISASRDGAWLTAAFELMGVGAVRGSSSWRGGPAMLEILRRLKGDDAGNNREDIGITPDGPRGPCYSWRRGAVQLDQKSGAPLFLIGMRFHRAWRLNSWDRFYLPVPFSRVDLLIEHVPPDDPDRQLSEDEFSEKLRQRLMALTDDSNFGH